MQTQAVTPACLVVSQEAEAVSSHQAMAVPRPARRGRGQEPPQLDLQPNTRQGRLGPSAQPVPEQGLAGRWAQLAAGSAMGCGGGTWGPGPTGVPQRREALLVLPAPGGLTLVERRWEGKSFLLPAGV